MLPPIRSHICAFALVTLAFISTRAGASSAGAPWQELQAQNRELRAQLQTQQQQLDDLRRQMDRLAGIQESTANDRSEINDPAPRGASDRKLVISGEVGLAFYSSSNEGRYRNEEFRVDDANIYIEAALARNAYFFGELHLAKHEALNEDFYLGEFYVDFEDISGALGGPERLVNLRFGRVNIPFGEEYLLRDPLANPLITHSLSDVWGTDEGVQLYGEAGRASYAFAVQNGSSRLMHDFNADKSLTLRVGYDVTSQLHLSLSGMRTGELASTAEPLSEVWFGNVVFRNIGSSLSRTHEADLAELDATYTWSTGRVWAAVGRARYRDNDPLADNTRDFDYFQVEAVQSLTREIYGAVRFSTLQVDQGYPIAGIGNLSRYFLGALQTEDLQRLSVGGGYRFNPSLVLKFDYTLEEATLTTGVKRDIRQVSFETALGF